MLPSLRLTLHTAPLAVVRLAPEAGVPPWASAGWFSSVTRTPQELSIVCGAADVPDDVVAERGYAALVVEGPLPFHAVGILAAIAAPLAAHGLSILAVCTYDTDYVLVRSEDVEKAMEALTQAGHQVTQPS